MIEIESQTSIDQQLEAPQQLIKELTLLYLANSGQPTRNGDIESLGQLYPQYNNILKNFQETLKLSAYFRELYHQGKVIPFIEMYFYNANEAVAPLLTDILLARAKTEKPFINIETLDYAMDFGLEAKAMVTELGKENLSSSQLQNLRLEETINAILNGNLKLTRQTQL